MDFKQLRKIYPGMWRCPRNPNLCCIYRVPNRIREINPEAYTPQQVLIGPLNHSLKSQALKSLENGEDITYTKSIGYLNMDERKETYLSEFAARFQGEEIIDGFKRMIKEEEENIRASYSESTEWINSPEFLDMILLDSVFIIEFMLRHTERRAKKIGDPLMDEVYLVHTIRHDLILLENQLPYSILEKLFKPIVPRIRPNVTFRDLIISYFGFEGKVGKKTKFSHFTDLLRCVHVETLPKHLERRCNPIDHMYSADKLDSGGVKFKAVIDELSLNVSFENGCLKMPCLKVYDKLEMRLGNIMALEQCHYPYDTYVCNYVCFLDRLIDTEKDVDLLIEKGIIQNWIGEPALLARVVNKLGLGMMEYSSYYWDIEVEVKAYYTNQVNKSKAILKRVYFCNLWTGTATISAIILLVMTLIQTWASVTQAKQKKS